MNWNQLKSKVYVWEGGWLDIYVHDTTRTDWQKWVQYVNQNYRIDWYNGRTERDETKIDFSVIEDFWDGNHDLTSTAKIFINNIQINAYFFDDTEIENDIDPREFNTIEDHNKLIDYLKELSDILDREVTLTPENCPEIILMKINGNSIEISIDTEPEKWPIRIKK